LFSFNSANDDFVIGELDQAELAPEKSGSQNQIFGEINQCSLVLPVSESAHERRANAFSKL
jgi:hypothetical protein